MLDAVASMSLIYMKWCMISCGLSMRTIGSRRRSALTPSRARVSSFSFTSSSWRAAGHCSRDTTSGRFPIVVIPGLLERDSWSLGVRPVDHRAVIDRHAETTLYP
jgi:hypothetical protein